jgi:type I restriction enzyme S subunit
MSQWKPTKLKDLCDKVTVGHVGTMAIRYQASGIPFLRSLNIKPFCIDLDDVKFIDEGFHHKLRKSALRPGDVVVVRTGYPGTAAVIPKTLPVSNCSDLVIIRPGRELNPHFITAIFNSAFGRTLVSGNTVGAAQQHFNITVAKELRFRVPLRPIQDKIVAILVAYDQLIENNRQRVARLETLAEQLYREWIVRLRWPGRQKKVNLVKGLPDGWERTKISALTSYLKRGVAPKYDDLAVGIAINQKCVRDGKVDLSFSRRQSREVSQNRYVRFGDVLVNSTGEGTLGRVAQVLETMENCIVDSHVTIVRPKPGVPIHYFGLALKACESFFPTMGQGATNQTELSPKVIGGIEIILPAKRVQEAFELYAAPIFSQITRLLTQSNALTRTRDSLLPRLISGKLCVEKLEIHFPLSLVADLTPERPPAAYA